MGTSCEQRAARRCAALAREWVTGGSGERALRPVWLTESREIAFIMPWPWRQLERWPP